MIAIIDNKIINLNGFRVIAQTNNSIIIEYQDDKQYEIVIDDPDKLELTMLRLEDKLKDYQYGSN